MKINMWFMYYSADTLFDLAFGKPFDMIKTGKGHWFLALIQESTKYLGLFGPIPWMFKLGRSFPPLMKDDLRMREWTIEQVKQRRATKVDEPDVMSWLLEPTEQPTTDAKENEAWLEADARLLIVAGTDTVSSTLTHAFYRLCSKTEYAEKIRQELTQEDIDKDFSVLRLQSCEYLNAFIDEVLRLHPAVPSGVSRNTPPQGLQIGDHYIPGEVTVAMPIWTMQRCMPPNPVSNKEGSTLTSSYYRQYQNASLTRTLSFLNAGALNQTLSSTAKPSCHSGSAPTAVWASSWH